MPDPDEPDGHHRIHWVRTDKPIVAGETTDGVEYLMSMVDVANGVGASLDPREWMFMNTDLVVHLHREPEGEWIGISAKAPSGPTASHDRRLPVRPARPRGAFDADAARPAAG